jgi:hypothetical protein
MNFNFLEFADFCLFCAGFSDNLVTVGLFWPLAHMSVTSAGLIPLQQQALGAKSAIRAVTKLHHTGVIAVTAFELLMAYKPDWKSRVRSMP